MYKLDFEKAEELEIKLPTSARSQNKQGNSRKTSISDSLTTLKTLTVWITTNWKNVKEISTLDHLNCLLRNLYEVKKQQLDSDTEHWTNSNWERSMSRLYTVTVLI